MFDNDFLCSRPVGKPEKKFGGDESSRLRPFGREGFPFIPAKIWRGGLDGWFRRPCDKAENLRYLPLRWF